MAPPTRRSSRLRGSTPQDTIQVPAPIFQLDAVTETQEMPNIAPPPPRAAQKSPDELPLQSPKSATKTPTKDGGIVPSVDEMHPALFHSVKKLTTVQRIPVPSTPTGSSSNAAVAKASPPAAKALTVPSKSTFDFRHGSVELSSEAQKMMDELRAQAARVKEELRAQDKTNQDNLGSENGIAGRRFALPKGKAGRFSDVHMANFKKMDSIANHASAFRADPGRSSSPTKSLKRKKSTASLEKVEATPARASSTRIMTPKTAPAGPPTRSAKRVKQLDGSAMSVQRESSFTDVASSSPLKDSSPVRMRKNNTLMTPTKSSLARKLVANGSKTDSKIPAPARSGSLKSSSRIAQSPTLARALGLPQTENSSKFRNALASKLLNVKSILRRPQPKFSDDPIKISAGTHLATPKSLRTEKGATTPQVADPGSPSHRAEKHVNFSASTAAAADDQAYADIGTPTPARKGLSSQGLLHASSVSYPTLSQADQLPSSPTPATTFAGAQPRAMPVGGPGDFTFRSNGSISFSSPIKPKLATPTVRKVRASNDNTQASVSKQQIFDIATIPHGLSNKKRKRENVATDTEDASDKENLAESASPSKKTKRAPLMSSPSKSRAAFTSTSSSPLKPVSSPSKRNVGQKARTAGALSISRLNALAMPKSRS